MSKFYRHLYNILFLAIFFSMTACSVHFRHYKDDISAINYDINKKVVKDTKISDKAEQTHQIQKKNEKNRKKQKDLFELGIEIGNAVLLLLLHI